MCTGGDHLSTRQLTLPSVQAYFFADSSDKIIYDDTFARLLSFYNVFVRFVATLRSHL